jgi:hypothetical protein
VSESSEQPSSTARPLRVTIAELGRLVRPAAALALVAMLLGQAVVPAVKSVGLASLIEPLDLVANISSHLLAFTATALSIGLLLVVGRDPRVSLVARVLLVAQAVIVLVLAVPASRFRLSSFACFFLGAVACSAAMVAAIEGIRETRSRALGLVLAILGIAAAARVTSAGLIVIPSLPQAERLMSLSTSMATGSVVLHAISLFVALSWIAARRRSTVSFGTFLALLGAMVVTWGAAGVHPRSPLWAVFFARLQDHLMPAPLSLLARSVDGFVVVLAPLVAFTALLMRRQMGAVVGALALVLTAGTAVDIPGRALIMVVGAVATVLAARDEQGMWEVLMGKRWEPAKPSSENMGQAPEPE